MRLLEETRMFGGKTKINVDLWPTGAWTQAELQELVGLFQEFESTSGQISSSRRGIGLHIGVTIVAGAVAAGFFGKLGSDLYDFVKARIKKFLLKSVIEPRTESSESIRRLDFTYLDPELGLSQVYYICAYSKASDLDAFFSGLQRVDSLIQKACNNQEFPFGRSCNHSIYAELEVAPRLDWNVRIRTYKEENGRLVLNRFFHSRFQSLQLEKLKWRQIKWREEKTL